MLKPGSGLCLLELPHCLSGDQPLDLQVSLPVISQAVLLQNVQDLTNCLKHDGNLQAPLNEVDRTENAGVVPAELPQLFPLSSLPFIFSGFLLLELITSILNSDLMHKWLCYILSALRWTSILGEFCL